MISPSCSEICPWTGGGVAEAAEVVEEPDEEEVVEEPDEEEVVEEPDEEEVVEEPDEEEPDEEGCDSILFNYLFIYLIS
jgi:hypothetical protein